MLTKLINSNLIQLGLHAENREQAIRISAQPLIDNGMINEYYMENILKVLDEVGPYFVLLPSVALPHARSEEGALENAIGITTLSEPVKFMSEANDPVKYIFTLSSVNNGQHLEALSTLAELFEDEEFFKQLDNAKNPDDVMNYLKEREEKKNVQSFSGVSSGDGL